MRRRAQPRRPVVRRPAVGRPELVDAANDSFVHAMHVAATTASAVALLGAVAIVWHFRAKPTAIPAAEVTPLPEEERAR